MPIICPPAMAHASAGRHHKLPTVSIHGGIAEDNRMRQACKHRNQRRSMKGVSVPSIHLSTSGSAHIARFVDLVAKSLKEFMKRFTSPAAPRPAGVVATT